MKPRLEAVLITDEDRAANALFAVTRGLSEFRAHVLVLSCAADRRDADLMLTAQWNRVWSPPRPAVPSLPPWLMPMGGEHGPIGGDIERYITYCA